METDYNKILQIPEAALLHKKLPKAFFLKHFKLSAAEKRFLNQDIEGMLWLASLRPQNINIPAKVSETKSFEEVQIISCSLKSSLQENAQKAIELIQKYLPYQVLLIIEDEHEFIFNSAEKLINQREVQKRTIQSYFSSPAINKLYKNKITEDLFRALAFSELDKTNLETTYSSYVVALTRFKAAQHTGSFTKKHHTRTSEDMEALQEIESLENKIESLANKIAREHKINEKVNLNIALQKHRKEIEKLKNKLSA